ncbi:cysteine desulfurase sulfur acceptor subunit CsdE [Orbaceae bacterium ac157xtp]
MLNSNTIETTFKTLTNWQDRYRQLILLAKTLPEYPNDLKTPENQITGCENLAWLSGHKNNQGKLHFVAESEGRIIKGLMAVLLAYINNKTAKEIKEMNLFEIFKQLKIVDELSDSRQLGLKNILTKAQAIAKNG